MSDEHRYAVGSRIRREDGVIIVITTVLTWGGDDDDDDDDDWWGSRVEVWAEHPDLTLDELERQFFGWTA